MDRIATAVAGSRGVSKQPGVERGRLEADEVRKQVLQNRQESGESENEKSGGKGKDRIVWRAPHRDHEQVILLQAIARLEVSKK